MNEDWILIYFFEKNGCYDINKNEHEFFFRRYDIYRKKFWEKNGESENLVTKYLKKDNTLSDSEFKSAMFYAKCMNQAYFLGRCYVKWDELFALPARSVYEILEAYYNASIKDAMPDVIEACKNPNKEFL